MTLLLMRTPMKRITVLGMVCVLSVADLARAASSDLPQPGDADFPTSSPTARPAEKVAAVPMSAPEKVALWTEQAPVGEGNYETANAFITVYRPAKANGAAAIICPGGGYGGLVTGAEGIGIAKWLNAHGVAGIVLEYRLPRGRPFVPLLDAQRAIRMVRANGKAWGCDPARIGIMGFSAGGHLASTAATHFDDGDPQAKDPINRFGCRPDFAVLVYPVITMGEKTHGGSKQNLLGPNPTPENVVLFSNEKQVTERTCPTFLAHALDDKVVPAGNSRIFYEALRAQKVASRYLELPSGDHGLNGYKGPMWDAWQRESLLWLAEQKMIPEQDAQEARTFPSFKTMANGAQQVRLLPGQEGFIVSMYDVPGEFIEFVEAGQ